MAAVAVALYAQAFARLRRRNSRHAGVANALLFLAGVALMMVEQAGTLGVAAALLFWCHVERLERSLAT